LTCLLHVKFMYFICGFACFSTPLSIFIIFYFFILFSLHLSLDKWLFQAGATKQDTRDKNKDYSNNGENGAPVKCTHVGSAGPWFTDACSVAKKGQSLTDQGNQKRELNETTTAKEAAKQKLHHQKDKRNNTENNGQEPTNPRTLIDTIKRVWILVFATPERVRIPSVQSKRGPSL